MQFSGKRIIILTLILFSLLNSAKLAFSADQNTSSDKSVFYDPASLLDNEPNLTIVGSSNNTGVTALFYKMILMLLLVIFLGVAVMYISKKLLPKINLPGKKIRLAETVHLGPKKSMHLVKIGNKSLLIGSTNENINFLADVTDEFSDDLEGSED